MQIINTNSISFIIVPSRFFTDGDIDLAIQYEDIRAKVLTPVNATYLNGEMTFTYDFEAIEGASIFVVANQNDIELCKFKIFCTDQTDLQNYFISEGKYKSVNASDNSFKTA